MQPPTGPKPRIKSPSSSIHLFQVPTVNDSMDDGFGTRAMKRPRPLPSSSSSSSDYTDPITDALTERLYACLWKYFPGLSRSTLLEIADKSAFLIRHFHNATFDAPSAINNASILVVPSYDHHDNIASRRAMLVVNVEPGLSTVLAESEVRRKEKDKDHLVWGFARALDECVGRVVGTSGRGNLGRREEFEEFEGQRGERGWF
ncbi:hypothetical protein M011DRAFT_487534 [Sporormia fimetaria CBS 119925]|uniref:Uncharacterized protein n=1 Tax=Sporormia fimetaria CBS 119925 TaxID=1340428 RepID=A0A6A6VA24_9PLEO|nr:hypothetical protein M011DRAFT_487534 [Sporormia fimetaria CBS 119925]